jgi:hypothetical protein
MKFKWMLEVFPATSKGFNSQHSLTHSHASINEIVVENMKHVVRTELFN